MVRILNFYDLRGNMKKQENDLLLHYDIIAYIQIRYQGEYHESCFNNQT